jgi:hypothetical protein
MFRIPALHGAKLEPVALETSVTSALPGEDERWKMEDDGRWKTEDSSFSIATRETKYRS